MDTGDKVHVEFDGTVHYVNYVNVVTVKGPLGGLLAVPKTCVTVLEPADWPPQIGDIWAVGEIEYCARENYVLKDQMVVEPIDAYEREESFYEATMCNFKALKPRLVRRRSE
jgi:hypothetical protein